MNAAAVITGLGLVTPLGRSTAQTWAALLEGRGIVDHARVEAASASTMSRVASLGGEAAKQAIAEAHWTGDRETAVVCCTSKGPVESWLDSDRRLGTESFGLGDFSSSIAEQTGFATGPRLTISSACASGLHGLIRAAMLIRSGQASRVLVVAAEASVHPLFLASFRRLGVLPPEGQLCRPFDLHRQGFLMSDATAAVCVEAADSMDVSSGFARVDRFAMGGDASHLTGSDPHGRVLRHLLRQTVGDEPIDLIHAHGTGTLSNDSIELAALESVMTQNFIPPLYSHKAALGHSLGASGLVAVVLNCMSHRTGLVLPNIHTADPVKTLRVSIGRQAEHRRIGRSLVHAAGFGGPTAVVTLRSRHSLSGGR